MKKTGIYLLIMLLLMTLLAGCGSPADSGEENTSAGLTNVKVVLDYVPNTNHTGLYAAKNLGYYEEAGLDVEIIEPTEGATATLIATGNGDFGIAYQEDVTYARASQEPLPVKAIATIIQHNTSGFAAVKGKNITSPKDFENKVYSGWGNPGEEAVIHAVMNKAGADFSTLTMLSSGVTDYNQLNNEIDFIWLFEGWDKVFAEAEGMQLDYMELRQLDERLDYYTPVIIASDDTIANNPELCQAFINATAKGYQYCMDEPDAAAEILHQYADMYDLDILKKSQEYLAGKYSEDSPVWGLMKDSVWDNYTDFMVEYDLIEKAVPASDCYTNQFIEGMDAAQ